MTRLTGTPYPAGLPGAELPGAATLVEGGQLHPQGPDNRQCPSASPSPRELASLTPTLISFSTARPGHSRAAVTRGRRGRTF